MSWKSKVRRVDPYTAGEQPKDPTVIKLNTNECPYPPSPSVAKALKELSEPGTYEKNRLYPDMDASELVNALAAKYDVDPEQIFVGVGSDDVLSMSFLTFFTNGKPVLFPDVTYSFYPVWASLYRIPYALIPLKDDFSLDTERFVNHGPAAGSAELGCMDENGEEHPFTVRSSEDLGGIVFPNPNAPTGLELPIEETEKIIASNPDCAVIVDEAYVDFGGTSVLPLLRKYDNLLVVQTFSKSRAMAGARIGFAIGNRELIRCLKDVKFSFNSYTLNMEAIKIGTAAAGDDAYLQKITSQIISTRENFKGELRKLGFIFPDSHTNFVFAKPPADKITARELFQKLREHKIIVRYFDKPRTDEYLRITIGTDEQMKAVTKALREILGE